MSFIHPKTPKQTVPNDTQKEKTKYFITLTSMTSDNTYQHFNLVVIKLAYLTNETKQKF